LTKSLFSPCGACASIDAGEVIVAFRLPELRLSDAGCPRAPGAAVFAGLDMTPFLDVRTAVFNDTLEYAFRRRHPDFRPANDDEAVTLAA
jgi:hypothetical protein